MLTFPVQLVKRDPKGGEYGMLAAPGEGALRIANTVSFSARLRRHFVRKWHTSADQLMGNE
jgi:hypothetical protein